MKYCLTTLRGFLVLLLCSCLPAPRLVAQDACQCTDQLYLNDDNLNLIHKFSVDGASGALTERGDPWLTGINSPHGVAPDLNGNVFIGEAQGFGGSGVMGPIFRVRCDGEVQETDVLAPEDGIHFNFASVDGVLYIPDNFDRTIRAYDECDGTLLGEMNFTDDESAFAFRSSDIVWGFTVVDGRWYLGERRFTGNIYSGSINLNQYTLPATNSGTALFSTGEFGEPTDLAPMGITLDDAGNIYTIINDINGSATTVEIRKYAPDGTLLASVTDSDNTREPTDGQPGFWGARGIVYSSGSDRLYVSSFVNCIAVFDTDLTEESALNVGNPNPNSLPKGIGLTQECCPGSPATVVDTTVCVNTLDFDVALSDFLNCDGSICEGEVTLTTSSPDIAFNECTNDIEVSGEGCATFVRESAGGAGTACGPFRIELNICFVPPPTFQPVVNCDQAPGQPATFSLSVPGTASVTQAGEAVFLDFNGAQVASGTVGTDGAFSFTDIALTEGPSVGNAVAVRFASGSSSCNLATTVDLVACTPDCTDAPTTLGGNVFNDFDNDGADDGDDEVGQPNVRVRVFDCDGSVVCDVFSNADGNWSCPDLTAGEDYRVEFSTEAVPFLATSSAGADNGTAVQFVQPGSCEVDYGVIVPDEYCGPQDPTVAVACYGNGSGVGNTGAGFITSTYQREGDPDAGAPAPVSIAEIQEVGTVWGSDYHRQQGVIYSGAFLRRHVGIGPAGYGGIYRLDPTGAAAPSSFTLEGVVPSTGGPAIDPGDVMRNLVAGTVMGDDFALPSAENAASNDLDAFGRVGKTAYGDLDLSESEDTLWAVNLNERSLIAVDLSDPSLLPTDGSAAPGAIVSRFFIDDIPGLPDCPGGVFRPWALNFNRGRGYLGGVCSAENSQDRADLSAVVLSFDPTDPAAGFTQELSFALDYDRELGSDFSHKEESLWQPWSDDYADFSFGRNTNGTPSDRINFAAPMFNDLAFTETGDMVIGLSDRMASQFGNEQYEPVVGGAATMIEVRKESAGDLIHVCRAGGTWVVENTAPGCFVNDPATGFSAAKDTDGPSGQGEYYWGEYWSPGGGGGHGEIAMGGLLVLPGTGEILTTTLDPINTTFQNANTQGFIRFDTETGGLPVGRYEVLTNNGTNLGKASGLGDPIVICDPLPIQLGNYVWNDLNGDGTQQACEPPLPGVPVALFDGAGNFLATTTTGPDGEYYFDDTDGVLADSNYTIVFGTDGMGNNTFDPATGLLLAQDSFYRITTPDLGEGPEPDRNDSDAAPGAGPLAGFPSISLNAGRSSNHTYDAGFTRQRYDLALRKTYLPGADAGVRPGDTLSFAITVINQGDTVAFAITVGDSLPAGLTYLSTGPVTTTDGAGAAVALTDANAAGDNPLSFVLDSLAGGDSVTFVLNATIDDPFTGTLPLVNRAEITAFDNDDDPANTPPTDEDSVPDDNFSNDAGGQPGSPADDATGGDGTGVVGNDNPATDEDDADPALVNYFDLALTKVVDPGSISPTASYAVGDPITFNINVTNQGTDTVANVSVGDNIPCGYTYQAADNPDWSPTGPNGGASAQDSVFTTLAGPLAPGSGAQVQLVLRFAGLGGCAAATVDSALVNRAEIRAFEDLAGNQPVDFDSRPDGIIDNDPGGMPDLETDNVITGDGTGAPGSNDPATDEDDADPASLNVFDLAIFKVVDSAFLAPPYALGDRIKFDIGVVNQGNLPPTEIVVADLIPEGLAFDPNDPDNAAAGWTATPDGASLTITPATPPGFFDTLTTSIYLTAVSPADFGDPEAFVNLAEITSGTYENPMMAGEFVTVTADGDSPYGLGRGNDTGTGPGTADDNETLDNAPGEDIDSQDPARIDVAGLTLGSTVFLDRENNGVQDVGTDPGLPGITVQLFDATTGDQVLTDADGARVTDPAQAAPYTTDAMGNYLFTDLLPGDYFIVLPDPPAEAPISSNGVSSGFVTTDPDDNTDADDDGLQPGGFGTAVTSGTITLMANDEPANEAGPGGGQDTVSALGFRDANGNMTLDLGLFAPVSVGDTAFVDLNGDGQQDDGDAPLGGVGVTILDATTLQPVALSADSMPYVATQQTQPNGSYLFQNLPPGSYVVEFDLGTADNAAFYDYTTPKVGDDATDSDAAPDAPEDDLARTAPTALLLSGQTDPTQDAGVVCAITVTGPPGFTVCATDTVDLTTGFTVTPAALGGSFSALDSDGTFTDAAGQPLPGPAFARGTATGFRPGPADARRGFVDLVLTTDDPTLLGMPSACPPVSAVVRVTILKVDCGSFFWDGGDD